MTPPVPPIAESLPPVPPALAGDPAALTAWIEAAPASPRGAYAARATAAAQAATAFSYDLFIAIARVEEGRRAVWRNAALRAAPDLPLWIADAVGEPDEDFPLHYVAIVGEARDRGYVSPGSPAWLKLAARVAACPPRASQHQYDADAVFAASVMLSEPTLPEEDLLPFVEWLSADLRASGVFHQIAEHPSATVRTFRALAGRFPDLTDTAWTLAVDFQKRPAAYEDPEVMAACRALLSRRLDPDGPLSNLAEHPAAGVLVERLFAMAATDADWRDTWTGVMRHFPFPAAMRIRMGQDPHLAALSSDDLREILLESDSRDLKSAVVSVLLPAAMLREAEAQAASPEIVAVDAPAVTPGDARDATRSPSRGRAR